LSILSIVGIRPSRHTLVGSVEGIGAAKREKWLETSRALGRTAR
jgi:hypothetical protein